MLRRTPDEGARKYMTVNQVPAERFVAPGFEAVRDAFSGVFAADGELGASLGVYADGEKRVDLQGTPTP
jgi:hypothetical protein